MNKKRILIVDDDVPSACLLKASLEQTGRLTVWTEGHGRRAVETARMLRPDLILLDVIMPDCDGGDVAQALARDPLLRDTPVVFVTSIVSEEEAGHGPIGGFRYLAKPVAVASVVECLEQPLFVA
ncbi:MAG: Polar-differentiation response regulator DivK [Verrucomicrobiae bacterium]|nr:Polar-differentiation response regulator DivK [Verrucomicrobiae bacterium]